MKLLKKLLALTLVGVLALTLLTGCSDSSTTDPDQVIPDDDTYTVVDSLNRGATEKGLGLLKYSVKYTAVTQKLLDNWMNNRTDIARYREERDSILDALDKEISIIVSEATVAPVAVPSNGVDGVNYSNYYTSSYDMADRVGVAFAETESGQRYMLICTFKTDKV